jgi:hypothetical protein
MTRPAEQRQLWFGAALAALAAGTVLGWKALDTTRNPPATSPALLQLATLAAYLAPTADSAFTPAHADTILLMRDPFGAVAPPRAVTAPTASTAPDTAPDARSAVVVNAVMITGSYRGAVINDQLINLGGRLPDGTRLTAVERDHVEFTDSRGTKRTVSVRDGNQ